MNTAILKKVQNALDKNSKGNPISVFSPGRINIIGEHTDYNLGHVLPAAIDLGIYFAITRSSSNTTMVHALDFEESFQFDLSEIDALQSNGWKAYITGTIRTLQDNGHSIDNFNLVFGGDLPIGAGLSSSASLLVGLLKSMDQLFKLDLTDDMLVDLVVKIEHEHIGTQCGIMDPYIIVHGKTDHACWLDCNNMQATHIPVDLGSMEFLLIDTNKKRELHASAYNDRRRTCEKIAQMLGKGSLREVNMEELKTLKDQVNDDELELAQFILHENIRVIGMTNALRNSHLDLAGALLYESHAGLRDEFRVSCPELDFLVGLAEKTKGVYGSRMMGGGFGGCTLNLIHTEIKEELMEKFLFAYKSFFERPCHFYSVNLYDGVKRIT